MYWSRAQLEQNDLESTFLGSWFECAGPNDFDDRIVDQLTFRPDGHVKFLKARSLVPLTAW